MSTSQHDLGMVFLLDFQVSNISKHENNTGNIPNTLSERMRKNKGNTFVKTQNMSDAT